MGKYFGVIYPRPEPDCALLGGATSDDSLEEFPGRGLDFDVSAASITPVSPSEVSDGVDFDPFFLYHFFQLRVA